MFHKKRILAVLIASVCAFSFLVVPLQVKSDSVTDTLSVCVGYYGMDLTDYVTVRTYHWSELEQALPIYEEAYSYFSSGTFDNEYTAIVDAAHGFLISDLLSYSDIYYGDIYNILFYVVDAQGIWTAFDRDSLFKTRYYFNDLAGHRTIIYGTRLQQVQKGDEIVTEEVPDYTKIEGYTFEQAWNDCKEVEPMLTLEDNWASFNEEFEHIGPDFSYMSTGSRFRLLFGQTEPTECMTRESAKYVSRVYITLNGVPSIGETPEDFDGSLGSHEVTLTIKDVYNKDMRDMLSEYLDLQSTNEEVLRIDKIKIEASEYSDVANVTISYSIIGEGEASLTAGIGSQELKNSSGSTLSQLTTVQVSENGGGEKNDQESSVSEPSNPDKPSSDEQPESSGQEEKPGQQQSSEQKSEGSSAGQAGQGGLAASGQKEEGDGENKGNVNLKEHAVSSDPEEEQAPEEMVKTDGEALEMKELPDAADQAVAYALTGDALQQLAKLQDSIPAEAKADRNITEVKVEEEEENDILLLFTGLGMLGIAVLGGISGYVSYRIRLKRSFTYLYTGKYSNEQG
ncbi:MAG: hypothetical protein ACI4D3_06855 [Lachnospiraceae bacterium]